MLLPPHGGSKESVRSTSIAARRRPGEQPAVRRRSFGVVDRSVFVERGRAIIDESHPAQRKARRAVVVYRMLVLQYIGYGDDCCGGWWWVPTNKLLL